MEAPALPLWARSGPKLVEHAAVVGIPDTLESLRLLHDAATDLGDDEAAEMYAVQRPIHAMTTAMPEAAARVARWAAASDPRLPAPKLGPGPAPDADAIEDAILQLSPAAAVLERCPDPDLETEACLIKPGALEFPAALASFCLPGGAEVLLAPRSPCGPGSSEGDLALEAAAARLWQFAPKGETIFSFALTDANGSRAYGHVLSVWAPLGGCPGLLARRSLCLLTRWPHLAPFRAILAAAAARLAAGGSRSALRAVVQWSLGAQGRPRPGQRVVWRAEAPTQLASPATDPLAQGQLAAVMLEASLARPTVPVLPALDGGCARVLIGRLGPEVAIAAWRALLMEQRLLIHSGSTSLLGPAAQALLSLVAPLAWPHPQVPVLPLQLLRFLTAPVPFLMGVRSEALGTKMGLSALPSAWILSLDAPRGTCCLVPPMSVSLPAQAPGDDDAHGRGAGGGGSAAGSSSLFGQGSIMGVFSRGPEPLSDTDAATDSGTEDDVPAQVRTPRGARCTPQLGDEGGVSEDGLPQLPVTGAAAAARSLLLAGVPAHRLSGLAAIAGPEARAELLGGAAGGASADGDADGDGSSTAPGSVGSASRSGSVTGAPSEGGWSSIRVMARLRGAVQRARAGASPQREPE
ncbi:hypothetical protein FNF28_01489 [Cafeteria roenbergensis]|uniref:UDENN domain-containing protein n=1 Tax=Cafeteria roenbergensis TaxID=33653 RepID=A0A5A8DYD9_CAFRO|nr:hypothetical protein FNF28_01489 [Cafeteria roenbergensis]